MSASPLVSIVLPTHNGARYLAESIRAWPAQAELAERIAETGWTAVKWRNLTGGIVALHRATKPPR